MIRQRVKSDLEETKEDQPVIKSEPGLKPGETKQDQPDFEYLKSLQFIKSINDMMLFLYYKVPSLSELKRVILKFQKLNGLQEWDKKNKFDETTKIGKIQKKGVYDEDTFLYKVSYEIFVNKILQRSKGYFNLFKRFLYFPDYFNKRAEN